MFKNSFAVMVALATLTLTVVTYAGEVNNYDKKNEPGCYTVVTPAPPNPITISLSRGSTRCTDAVSQIGKTANFGGTNINSIECVGTNYFCCATKNANNTIAAVYCQPLQGSF